MLLFNFFVFGIEFWQVFRFDTEATAMVVWLADVPAALVTAHTNVVHYLPLVYEFKELLERWLQINVRLREIKMLRASNIFAVSTYIEEVFEFLCKDFLQYIVCVTARIICYKRPQYDNHRMIQQRELEGIEAALIPASLANRN